MTAPLHDTSTTGETTTYDLQLRYWRAVGRAMAARVPDGDRAGGSSEPVTTSGHYAVPTVSGRPAWARYMWRGGRCEEDYCTYDPIAEKRVVDLIVAGADPAWPDDGNPLPPWKRRG
jgi:hypothetical protein